MDLVRENERVDDLGRRGFRVIQNPSRFCFGIDATFLAWFAEVKEGEKVLDLCTGTGIVMLLMDARHSCGEYVGLEIQPDVAEMCARSILLNDVADHMRVVTGDVKEASQLFPKASFDVITVNPPYMAKGNGLVNPDRSKAIARHELLCSLSDVIRESAALLNDGGRLYMVHRPSRLAEILQLTKTFGLSVTALQTIHPFPDDEATMILVKAVRGGHKILRVEHPLIIYKEKGVYTVEVEKIYRE